jgi:hypothetical protein
MTTPPRTDAGIGEGFATGGSLEGNPAPRTGPGGHGVHTGHSISHYCSQGTLPQSHDALGLLPWFFSGPWLVKQKCYDRYGHCDSDRDI